jgi:elongation of very long chain fatty acids protein 7
LVQHELHAIALVSDPRTKSWFLSNTPGPLMLILVSYLYFCLYAGPQYMKNRKPFQLKNTLIVYNLVQVIFSVVLVVEVRP